MSRMKTRRTTGHTVRLKFGDMVAEVMLEKVGTKFVDLVITAPESVRVEFLRPSGAKIKTGSMW